MSLTGGYDFCVEMTIAVVREIFHLALKQEDRFPHNFGPLDRTFSVPGGSPLHATINVRLYDEDARPADLRFTGVTEMTFRFPFDVQVQIAEAPTPELSSFLLQLVLEVPAQLTRLPASDEDGPNAIGLDFSGVTPDKVNILEMSPLPTVDSAALTGAFHQAYEAEKIPHQTTQGAFTLTIYDGGRDSTLNPPNSSGAEIQAMLEAGDWVQVQLPIHISGTQDGYTLGTDGTVTFFRQLVRTDDAVILKVSQVPAAADSAHATQVSLVNVPGVDASVYEAQLHAAYASKVLPHTQSSGVGTVNFYDVPADPSLSPQDPGQAISAAIETDGGTTYLHIQIPCWASGSGFSSFGTLHVNRIITTTTTTISVDFGAIPSDASRKTHFEMDLSYFDGPLNAEVPLIETAFASIGVKSGPNPAGTAEQAVANAIDQATLSLSDIVQAAPSDARAHQLVQQEVAGYLSTRKFPVYSPDPGENSVTLSEPTGKLLVSEEVLAIQLTPRAGEPDEVPDSFVGDKRMALAVGKAFVDERIAEGIDKTFPNLHTSEGDKIEEIKNRNVYLTSLSVTLGDGQLNASGSARVEVCCWKDPVVNFSGPLFLETTLTEDDQGCHLAIQVVAGNFDIDQSSCDIFLEIIIPVVGWIVGAVISSTIDAVGGGIISGVASSQGDLIAPIPPVVLGIAAVRSCLLGLNIRPDGFVFPGRVDVERVDRSFNDLSQDNRQPSGGDG